MRHPGIFAPAQVFKIATAFLLFLTLTPAAAADGEAPGYAYEVAIEGAGDELETLIEDASTLIAREDDAPGSPAALARRIDADRRRIGEILRAEGYHDGTIAFEEEEGPPRRVVIRVEPGPRYVYGDYEIVAPGFDEPMTFEREDLGVPRGDPARADNIVSAEAAVVTRFGTRGHPFAEVVERKVIVDHEARTVNVRETIDVGAKSAFGAVSIEGLADVDEVFVTRRIAWQEGELYDEEKVQTFRRRLVESGLFETVAIEPGAPGADGRVPMAVTLTERKHRTIGLGLSYSTAEGAGGKVFWTHRNMFGQGERVRLTAEAGQRLNQAKAELRKPDFFGLDNALIAEIRAVDETTDAFESLNAGASVGVERRVSSILSGALSIGYDHLEIEQNLMQDVFDLVSLRGRMTLDTTDDLLDPRQGVRATFAVTPEMDIGNNDLFYVRNEVTASGYLDVLGDGELIAALRGRFGSIVGADTMDIPATRRFYAGGGGSVRGYGYQQVGPLDAMGDPLGGRSVLEIGGELRIRVTESIGIVPFIDGGQVYNGALPNLDQGFLWGAGIGVRYYTAVGPIRADIAFPINPRNGDDSFQFYISLGQAF